MWEEGRLSPAPVATTHFAFPAEPRAGVEFSRAAVDCGFELFLPAHLQPLAASAGEHPVVLLLDAGALGA